METRYSLVMRCWWEKVDMMCFKIRTSPSFLFIAWFVIWSIFYGKKNTSIFFAGIRNYHKKSICLCTKNGDTFATKNSSRHWSAIGHLSSSEFLIRNWIALNNNKRRQRILCYCKLHTKLLIQFIKSRTLCIFFIEISCKVFSKEPTAGGK